MLQLDPRLIANIVGRDLIAFGTGGLGKTIIPYLAQEPDIKLHGVTNSRITEEDAGTFLDTRLPIRSLSAWAERMPDATILLCVAWKNEASSWAACEAAGFQNIMQVPVDLVDMLQVNFNISRNPCAHPMFSLVCLSNELHDMHKATFSEFRSCHRGRTVAVVGTGPSMDYYAPVQGIPHIGVNASVLREDLKLDYYFLAHYIPEWCNKLKNYDCIKFIERTDWSVLNDRFPEYVIEELNARRYFASEPSRDIRTNIEYHPLMGYYSIIFRALNFAIFTRPKRILLIGCDCLKNGHYSNGGGDGPMGANVKYNLPIWVEGHKSFKHFLGMYYPDTEVISVNPTGLKGIFRDMYTKSYLEAHPELDRATCEIFDPQEFKEN